MKICFSEAGLVLCDQENEACYSCAKCSLAIKTPRVESGDQLVEHAAIVMESMLDFNDINTALGNFYEHTRLAKTKKKVLSNILTEVAKILFRLHCSGAMLYYNLLADQLQNTPTEAEEQS